MYYRRKVVLSIIQLLADSTEKMSIQKIVFLYSQRKAKAEYDFIPYKYGCYSYSLKADLNTMVNKGLLSESEHTYEKEDKVDYHKLLRPADQLLVQETVASYGQMTRSQLISHTYINYPFYAIHSTIAQDVVGKVKYSEIQKLKPSDSRTVLFTIGYEGISLETYLLRLVENNVKMLIDVRKNAQSMKFGFSKKRLSMYCDNLGIEYVHYPEVGIESDKRKKLKDQNDYNELFEQYTATTLRSETAGQLKILNDLKDKKRVALTCFEAEFCQCHRSHLARSISMLPAFDYSIVHI